MSDLDMPGRHFNYRYQTLATRKIFEFGTWALHNCMLHRRNDIFIFALDGHRIIEVHPDDSCYLVMPPDMSGARVGTCWSHLAPKCAISCVKKRRASGLDMYEVTRYQYTKGPTVRTDELMTSGRVRYGLDGRLSIENLPQRIARRDGPKYRAFNRKLRDLRAVLYTQIRMQTKVEPSGRDMSALQEKTRRMLRDSYGVEHYYTDAAPYALVNAWMEHQNPMIASQIADLAFSRCSTSARGIEGMMRMVTNIIGRAQRYYLREHCVTILDQYSGSTNDPKSELLQADGLREMQVPGSA